MTQPIASLRLSDTDRKALLQNVSQKANASPLAANRTDSRYALPPEFSVLGEFFLPGGAVQRVIVSLRDISRGGLAMLHSNYVHNGTKCMFVICDKDRKPIATAAGEVVRCDHVRGTIHDLGVKFAARLPVEALVRVTNHSVESGNDNTRNTYPALMSLCDDLFGMVRAGAPLDQIHAAVCEVQEALKAALAKSASEKQAA